MMNRSTIDLWVGIFVVAGIAALLVPRAQGRQPGHLLGSRDLSGARPSSPTSAASRCAAPVKSAGVVVGRVADIRFDNESYEAMRHDEHRPAATSSRSDTTARS